MSSACHCPRCGSVWAGVEGVTTAEALCLDCLTRPEEAPTKHERRVARWSKVAAASLAAIGLCTGLYAM